MQEIGVTVISSSSEERSFPSAQRISDSVHALESGESHQEQHSMAVASELPGSDALPTPEPEPSAPRSAPSNGAGGHLRDQRAPASAEYAMQKEKVRASESCLADGLVTGFCHLY